MSRIMLALLVVLACWQPMEARAAEEPTEGFWSPYYLIDYGLGAGGLLLEFLYRGEPREQALFGPSFDPSNPAAILDPQYSDLLGNPFMPEHEWTIPNLWLEAAAYGQLLMVPAHELLARWGTGREISAQRLHHSLVSVFQATAVNAGLSRMIKASTGRLRPDFQDRVRHVYCSLPDENYGIDCTGVETFDDPETALSELKEGRYSFVSGHASNAMLVATNLALQTGGLWVWGDGATPTSRGAGIAAMAVLYGMATYSGLSRTSLVDGVHHPTDVLAGSLLGIGIGNLFYWLHFDTSGNPRPHWLKRSARSGAPAPGLTDVRLLMGGTSVTLSAAW